MTSRLHCILVAAGVSAGVLFAPILRAATASDVKQIVLGAPSTTFKQPTKAGTYRVQLVNVIPKAHYVVEAEIRVVGTQIPEPLKLDPKPIKASAHAEDPCPDARASLQKGVNEAKSEEDIYKLSAQLESELKKAKCADALIALDRTTFDTATTLIVDGGFPVDEGEDLVVEVSRSKTEGFEARKLGLFTYATKRVAPGTWLALYGVNFIRGDDEVYFTKANPSTSPQTYTITRSADRQDNVFAPSIYFMWIKERNYNNMAARVLSWNDGDVFGGLAAGLGFDFDSPTAFLGYGIGWGYNVMLTAGVAMNKVSRLNGRYQPGDVVSENLSDQQLTEGTYKPNAYVGLAFRFGSNPFKKSEPIAAAPASATN